MRVWMCNTNYLPQVYCGLIVSKNAQPSGSPRASVFFREERRIGAGWVASGISTVGWEGTCSRVG